MFTENRLPVFQVNTKKTLIFPETNDFLNAIFRLFCRRRKDDWKIANLSNHST